MRKIISLLVAVLVLPIALAACTGPDTSGTKEHSSAPVSTAGTYKSDGMVAEVTPSDIQIFFTDGSETKSLYWKGTFKDGYGTIVSTADANALAESITGSQDLVKDFTVQKNDVSFKLTIAGTQTVVHMKK